ncbi:MAG: glycosyltransferase [Saprospiraceae bacterium]|nr:glycosyltransferase [Saprospiraceae bacterium]
MCNASLAQIKIIHPSKFEVIVVDDQSEDATYELLEKEFTQSNFRLMDLVSIAVQQSEDPRKKKAISYGVSHAQGDIIVQTDADCNASSNGLTSMVTKLIQNDYDLVTDPANKRRIWFVKQVSVVRFHELVYYECSRNSISTS